MEFSLVHTGLAAGAALAAVPVLLHLFMRQTPKHVVFPALRLIRERHKRSRKTLRVKNWLLLLARMALLALMALALARPRIVSEASVGDQEIPTALGLVFDTSLSMGYTPRDKTLLEEAKERAYELLKKTPDTSQVFVVDPWVKGAHGPLTPASAVQWIKELTLHPAPRPLNSAVGDAYAAVAESDRSRREVYVLTDLAASAWEPRAVTGLEKAAKEKIKTYVLRLTPREVRDVAVVEAGPVSDVVAEGQPVEIRAKLRSLGPKPASRVAELKIDGVSKGKVQVEVPAGEEKEVKFPAQRVDPSRPVHQGVVHISGEPDPAEFDDRRYFTFALKPPVNVLVVSDLPADAEYVADAIEPEPEPTAAPGPGGGQVARPFHVDVVPSSGFAERSVGLGKRYRCVFLNNVAQLTESEWARLSGFVVEGGGLVVGLGRRSSAENYTGPTATQILPASLEKVVDRTKEPTTFGPPADQTHPVFGRYARGLADILTQVPVSRYWEVKVPDGSNARVLLAFADKSPALVERVFKGSRVGRVLLWTTPLSTRPEPNSPDAWNELPDTIVSGWAFYAMMLQTVSYLAGTAEEALNFEAGKDVILPLDPTRRYKTYSVQPPDKAVPEDINPPTGSDSLVVVAPQSLGNWSVRATATEGKDGATGFSVNPPLAETQFTPLKTEELDVIFGGKDRYALADDPESLERAIQTTRIGREMFPWLIMLIMIVVTVESVLANRFYREAGPKAVPARA
jgi:hypothetical protein